MPKAKAGFTLVKQGDKGPRSFMVSRTKVGKPGATISVTAVGAKDKDAIRRILIQHAVGLRNLADR